MGIGRPLSIDDMIVDPRKPDHLISKGDAILYALGIGVPREVAAKAAGVDKATFYRWLARGAEYAEMTDDELTPEQARLREFREDVEKADAEAVVFAVEAVRKAMPTTWQAGMTWLERRYPSEWGRRVEVAVDPSERNPAPVDALVAAEAEEAFLAAALPEGLTPEQFLPDVDVPVGRAMNDAEPGETVAVELIPLDRRLPAAT